MTASIYEFPTGRRLDTPPPEPPRDETRPLSEAAASYYRQQLEHHESRARVYRKLLGARGLRLVSSEEES